MRRAWALLLIATLAVVHGVHAQDTAFVVPQGTHLSVRINQSLAAGRDTVGSLVRLQLMAALVHDDCIAVPAFAPVVGHVTRSKGGRSFGRSGVLAVQLDSLQLPDSAWVPLDAVIDSIEWASPHDVSADGTMTRSRHAMVKHVALVAGGLLIGVPVPAIVGVEALRRGSRPRVISGELAVFRTSTPFSLKVAGGCALPVAALPVVPVPSVPALPARTTNLHGDRPADPVNLLLLGSAEQVAQAFARAGWTLAANRSVARVAREVGASVIGRPYAAGPVSSLYLYGRKEDVAFERASPSARRRHHLRLWHTDSTAQTWVGSATEDVGIKFNPLIGQATHRIAPDVDRERDEVVRELELGGCAKLIGFDRAETPALNGKNLGGDPFESDGNIAVVQLRCLDTK